MAEARDCLLVARAEGPMAGTDEVGNSGLIARYSFPDPRRLT